MVHCRRGGSDVSKSTMRKQAKPGEIDRVAAQARKLREWLSNLRTITYRHRSSIGAECVPHLFRYGVEKRATNQIRLLSLKLLGISHRKRRFRVVHTVPRIVGFPAIEFRSFRINRRRRLNRSIRRFLTLQLLHKKLILQPHIFELLLHLPLLFGQLVLPLLLLLKLFLLQLELLL